MIVLRCNPSIKKSQFHIVDTYSGYSLVGGESAEPLYYPIGLREKRRRDIMNFKKDSLSYALEKQTVHNTLNGPKDLVKPCSNSYSTEEMVELMSRLPAFAPKPVCKFVINGHTMFGKLEHKKESCIYIRHKFGKKVVKYHIEQLQSIDILKY
jgi:hypothetical protein